MIDDIEIIEDVKPVKEPNKKKKSKMPLLIILLLLIIVLGVVALYKTGIINFESNDNTPKETKTEVNIPIDIKKELLNIVGLKENGHDYLTDKELKNLELTTGKYIDLYADDMMSIFIDLSNGKDFIINDLNDLYKKDIIFKYANFNDLLTKDGCSFYLSKDKYENIIKKFGIDKIEFLDSEIVGDNYNYNLPCEHEKNIIKFDENISFDYESNGIALNYTVKMPESNIDRTIKYSFNKRDDGSYYLFKFNIKNN